MRMFTISMGLSVKQLAVFLFVQGMEGLPDLFQPGLVQLACREGHAQLVALADVAQIAGAALLHPVGAEAGGPVLGHEGRGSTGRSRC